MPIHARTFGVLDRVEIADIHVVSVEGGSPLAALPESTTPLWTSGGGAGTYAPGSFVHRVQTHTVYARVSTHTEVETTPPEDSPPTTWKVFSATNKWRMFDLYRSTATVAQERLNVVLRPRVLVDTVDLQGLRATTVSLTIEDGPGGAVIYDSGSLSQDDENATDWAEYFFGYVTVSDARYFTDLPVCADPVITIELAFPGSQVELGSLQIGRYIGIGWTEYDTDIGIISYSYLKAQEDGTVQWRKRPGAGDMNVRVFVEPEDSNTVVALLSRFEGVPTLWIGHTEQAFSALRKTGFFDGRLSYPNFGQRTLTGRVRGVI